MGVSAHLPGHLTPAAGPYLGKYLSRGLGSMYPHLFQARNTEQQPQLQIDSQISTDEPLKTRFTDAAFLQLQAHNTAANYPKLHDTGFSKELPRRTASPPATTIH